MNGQGQPALEILPGRSEPAQLLRSKIHVPTVRPDPAAGIGTRLVPRPRLIERLDRGLRAGCKLVLVSAPAGFGKTALISAWLSASRCPAAWISLDRGDNDPVRFLRYLIAALQTIEPQLGQTAEALLQSLQLPPLDAVLTTLVNELCALPDRAALVLDDYHLIDAPDVHRAVGFLLDHLPPQIPLMLLTRADPPLPISRLRARDQLVECRAADLRFTTEEASAFLNQVMELDVSAADAAAIETHTEGWIAGLQLAAIALRSRLALDRDEDVHAFAATFAGGHRYIMDYLVDEVLDLQPEQTRSFLLQTSILERLCGPLCDAVTGRAGGQEMLKTLEQANLFVVSLDDERRWYRYHHLFAEVLHGCLEEASPDRLLDLHRRAAAWYEQNGLVSEALGHALSAGDRDHAAALVEANARSMLMRAEFTTLANWIKALDDIVHQHPWLGLHRVWALILTGQMEPVERLLQELETSDAAGSLPDPAERQDLRGEIATIRGLFTFLQGDAPHAVQLCREALATLREEHVEMRGIAAYALGEADRHTGDLDGAVQAYTAAARSAKASGNVYLAVAALTSHGDTMIGKGRLGEAAALYEQALQWTALPNEMRLPAAGRVYACMGKVFYEWNDLPAATRCARQGIALCQQGGIVEYMAASHVVLAQVRQAQGDLDGVHEAIRAAEQLLQAHRMAVSIKSWMVAGRVRLWLAQGDLDRAARWAAQFDLRADDPAIYVHEPEVLALLHVLLALDEAGAVLERAAPLLHTAEATGRMGRAIALLTLQALAWQVRGDMPRALAALGRTLSLARPEGYVRTFCDEGPSMARLLRQAGAQSMEPDYVNALLSAMVEAPHTPPPPGPSLIEPLSERELQVLRLLAAGRSNQEIAAELVLAVGTVKRHLNNIFGKLGATNRTECAARARDLGLL